MKKTLFVVDVETDGPNLVQHSMFWFGAVRVDERLETAFEGRMHPVTDAWVPEALAVSGKHREEILEWPEPAATMRAFADWVHAHTRPGTRAEWWSDNNSFDLMWLKLYTDRYLDEDLFGHTSRNLSDRHKGLVDGAARAGRPLPRRIRRSFVPLRHTPHDHDPVNDARGNAEALLGLRTYGLRVPER